MKELAWYIPAYTPSTDDDCKAMREAVTRKGLQVFVYEDAWPSSSSVFFYGSIEGMKDFQWESRYAGLGWINWCDWGKLACTHYYAQWGDLLLTRDYGFYPLAELKRLQGILWQRYCDWNGYVYVRPNDNDKVFSGGIFKKDYFYPWLLQADPGKLTDDLLCLVGKPSPIHAEYRLVVANGKVVTGSRYIWKDKISYDPDVPTPIITKAEEAAKIWSPHPVFVLDMALCDGYCRIIECGSIHTAGLYGCDFDKVVDAILEGVRSEHTSS